MSRDLTKENLYEGVKLMLEADTPHLLLNQHKLFTLYSVGFQYMLYLASKDPGTYIIRIEDSSLAEKLAKKAKDQSSRKFIQTMLLSRKTKFQKSNFYLDFFHPGTWGITNDVPKEKLKGAIIVKNSSSRPLDFVDEEGESPEIPKDLYYTSLRDTVKQTILIDFDGDQEGYKSISLPFIEEYQERNCDGVTIGKGIKIDINE